MEEVLKQQEQIINQVEKLDELVIRLKSIMKDMYGVDVSDL